MAFYGIKLIGEKYQRLKKPLKDQQRPKKPITIAYDAFDFLLRMDLMDKKHN